MATEYIGLPGELIEKVKRRLRKKRSHRRNWCVMPLRLA
jgi:hypothetical protein